MGVRRLEPGGRPLNIHGTWHEPVNLSRIHWIKCQSIEDRLKKLQGI